MSLIVTLIVVLSLCGAWGRWRGWGRGDRGRVDGEVRERIAEMEAELDRIRDLRERVVELEERLEFTERMLAREHARDRLPPRGA